MARPPLATRQLPVPAPAAPPCDWGYSRRADSACSSSAVRRQQTRRPNRPPSASAQLKFCLAAPQPPHTNTQAVFADEHPHGRDKHHRAAAPQPPDQGGNRLFVPVRLESSPRSSHALETEISIARAHGSLAGSRCREKAGQLRPARERLVPSAQTHSAGELNAGRSISRRQRAVKIQFQNPAGSP